MIPYIDLVVTEQEMDLVVNLGAQEMTVEQIAGLMGLPLDDAQTFVAQAYRRGVISQVGSEHGQHAAHPGEDVPRIKASSFYGRLDPMAMYGRWGDVPAQIRAEVIEWGLQEFILRWQPPIDEIARDADAHVLIPNRDYLLLQEALEMVEAATDHVVVPCDCKSIVRACDRPREVCVRLDQGARAARERGQGRRVSKEEMKQIVLDADRASLMHTGERNWRQDGQLFGFCNCWACDCYPIRAGVKPGLGDAWPRVHAIAERDLAQCHLCGMCTRRCHFGAFYYDGSKIQFQGRQRKNVLFDAEKCRGCGICATACPEGAIRVKWRRETDAMEPVGHLLF